MRRARHIIDSFRNSLMKSRNRTFALEGGYHYGPGHDPKGDFYSPRLGVYWYQPAADLDDARISVRRHGLMKWISRFKGVRKTA